MELYQLRSFVAVAEEGTLARAAMRLFSSQPSVSAHIKALEDELGIALFDRSSRGMQITPDGEAMLTRAYAILRETTALNNLARDLQSSPSGKLTIGVNTGSGELPLETIAAELYQSCPKLQLEFLHSSSGYIKKGVLEGDIDIGFYEGEIDSPKIISSSFQENSILVIASPEFKDALQTTDWRDLQKLPWVFKTPDCSYYQLMDRIVKAHDLDIERRYTIDEEGTCLRFVRNGAALSLIGESLVRDEISRGEIVAWDGFKCQLPHSLICLGSRYHERAIQACFDACSKSLKLSKPQ
ncbi:LysR family transcriptional regulator [Pelagicoccus sp. SDUM812002]|uniref:LysR family transcriptional regulator n=1 Tax=Pelagicoccus sp. SDUM812002 TaxID=3041266 RepID=UPI00280DCD70|nr:LysR family transcriptional regulator [Pelagicoccus sp. SDUM812002]MDQ8185023.1 LysR family transcriptional regulator [Pelagicoccus sp. SDUM812002]